MTVGDLRFVYSFILALHPNDNLVSLLCPEGEDMRICSSTMLSDVWCLLQLTEVVSG